jgi:hypothetical protein
MNEPKEKERRAKDLGEILAEGTLRDRVAGEPGEHKPSPLLSARQQAVKNKVADRVKARKEGAPLPKGIFLSS